jgi:hypothetical protein
MLACRAFANLTSEARQDAFSIQSPYFIGFLSYLFSSITRFSYQDTGLNSVLAVMPHTPRRIENQCEWLSEKL